MSDQPRDYADFCAQYVNDHTAMLARIVSHQDSFKTSLDELKVEQRKTDQSVADIREKVFNGLSELPTKMDNLQGIVRDTNRTMVGALIGLITFIVGVTWFLGTTLGGIGQQLDDHMQWSEETQAENLHRFEDLE